MRKLIIQTVQVEIETEMGKQIVPLAGVKYADRVQSASDVTNHPDYQHVSGESVWIAFVTEEVAQEIANDPEITVFSDEEVVQEEHAELGGVDE